MDRLPEKIDSKFRYVLLAAQRAEQIMRGAAPQLDLTNRPKIKHTRIAMEEIEHDHIQWEYGARPVHVTTTSEEAEAPENDEETA